MFIQIQDKVWIKDSAINGILDYPTVTYIRIEGGGTIYVDEKYKKKVIDLLTGGPRDNA